MEKRSIADLGFTDEQKAILVASASKRNLATEDRKSFWKSDLCARMIGDIMRTNMVLACDDPHYDLKGVQARYGWEDLSEDTIKLFIATCTDGQAAPIELYMPEDEEDEWSCWACIKRGLYVHSMSGQGTVYTIRPATEEEINLGKPAC